MASPILVTGAAGFIGSHVAEALLARGERVVGLDNFSDYYDPAQKQANAALLAARPGFELVTGDIRSTETVNRLFEQHRFERIIHLAAMAGVRYSVEHPALYVEVNLTGTLNLLEAARRHGTQHVVFASTSSVYGGTAQIPFVESDSADQPLAPYPATKRAGELLGHVYHHLHGLNFTALRFFSVYGPRGRPDMMPYLVADSIWRQQPLTLFNNGEMWRDWTYVDDITAGVVAALDRPTGYALVNLGRGEPVSMRDFVRRLEELSGRPAVIRAVPAPLSEPARTYASIARAQELFGYAPRYAFHDGMARFWDWFKSTRRTEPG